MKQNQNNLFTQSECKKKRIIWSYDFNVEDFEDYLEENFSDESLTDDEKWCKVSDLNYESLDDERMNLDKLIEGDIIAIGDIGRWNGRVIGYKELNSYNLNSILSAIDSESTTFYSNGYDIMAEEHHHDGTNYIMFRMIKDGVDKDLFLSKIGRDMSRDTLNRYSTSLVKEVNAVYGW